MEPRPSEVHEDFESDIPLDLAITAHRGTSHSPGARGASERRAYAAMLRHDYESLREDATTPEALALLDSEFARYRAGMRTRKLAQLHAHSRTVSVMVAGPANFPKRRMVKRNETEARRQEDIHQFRERALAAIRKNLRPDLRPIMAGDADATTRLEEKIAQAEAEQNRMKQVNHAIRKHAKAGPQAQAAALVALNISEKAALGLLAPDELGRVGYPDYALKNNGARTRDMKARLATLKTAKATPSMSTEGPLAQVEDVPAENRVRLFFAVKPSAAVRARLKSANFHWSPQMECWQAYRNAATLATARAEAGLPPLKEPESPAVPDPVPKEARQAPSGTRGPDAVGLSPAEVEVIQHCSSECGPCAALKRAARSEDDSWFIPANKMERYMVQHLDMVRGAMAAGEHDAILAGQAHASHPAGAAERLAAIRKILAEQTAALVDGVLVDIMSASAYIRVHDGLSERNQTKLTSLPAPHAMDLVWRLMTAKDKPAPGGP